MDFLKKMAELGITQGVPTDVEFYSTGIQELDYLINAKGGGIPKGRITEIFGEYSSGKSALAYSIIGAAQKEGKKCLFANVEGTLDFNFATKLFGVQAEKTMVMTCDMAEDYLVGIEKVIEGRAVDIIVVDSIEALVPKAETEADYKDALMGVRAKLLNRFCRRSVPLLRDSEIALVVLNQSRIDFMSGFETTPGGKALKFYSSLRLHLQKASKIKQGEEIKGTQTRIKVEKNKVGQPFGTLLIDFLWEKGFDATADWVGLALGAGKVERKGNTYFYKNEKIGVGLSGVRAFLQTKPELMEAIKAEL